MGERHSHKHLSALSSRSTIGAHRRTKSPLRGTNTDLKEQVDPSMQSGELLVDMMKLQNIFNFELHKLLKSLAPDLVLVQDGKQASHNADNNSNLIETQREKSPTDI